MSIQAVGWVLGHERATTGRTRLVLLALANYADEAGECYPSVHRLAADANCDERTVQRALNAMVRDRIIARERQAATDRRIPNNRRPNLYRILGMPEVGVTPVSPLHHQGWQNAHPGVTKTTFRGDTGVTQTITEPSKIPQPRARARVAPFAVPPPIDELRKRVHPKRGA